MRLLALIAALVVPQAHPSTSLHLRPIGHFDSPVYLAAPRTEPNRVYVVEQAGRVRVVENGKELPAPFLDITDRVGSGGERGLLSVAFHPDYAENHLFYVYYTDKNGDIHVVEYRSDGQKAIPGSARQILFVDHPPAANHNGGQLQFGPDGLLYAGTGDGGGGGDTYGNGQSLARPLAKLLRINASVRGARWRVVGFGLRNPWRFSFDRATGDLYIADVGQGTWEEIDYLKRGWSGLKNFGWNHFEGQSVFDGGEPILGRGSLVSPVAVYRHENGNCSVTGGYVYRGAAVPAARGRYFYGDYCSGDIFSFRIAGGRVTGLRREALHVDQLSSFGEDARGELYACSQSGTVYRLTS